MIPMFLQVRNSVGANCYVSDEIITSRTGVRMRIGNTDAEVSYFSDKSSNYSKLII